MSIINKAVRGLGKITGTSVKLVKEAPAKTMSTSKSLKDSFVEGLQSNQTPKTPELPQI